jgi:ketosteroid isomerase-like protein
VSEENVEIVRAGFEPWNAGVPDMDAHLARFHADLIYHPRTDEPDPSPQSRDAYERLLRGFVESFSEFAIELRELIDVGEYVIASTVLHGRIGDGSGEVTDPYVMVFKLRDGLIAEVWEYRTKEEALGAVELLRYDAHPDFVRPREI